MKITMNILSNEDNNKEYIIYQKIPENMLSTEDSLAYVML